MKHPIALESLSKSTQLYHNRIDFEPKLMSEVREEKLFSSYEEKMDLSCAASINDRNVTHMTSISEDVKQALTEFYLKFNPEKISTIDHILQQYKNKEIELLRNLMDKYHVKEYKLFDNIIQKENDKVLNDETNQLNVQSVLTVSKENEKQLISPRENQSTSIKQSIPVTPTKELSVSSVQQPNSLSTLSIGMQDISTRLFTGWGSIAADSGLTTTTSATSTIPSSKNGIASDNSVSSTEHDTVWLARMSSLNTELQTALGEKVAAEAEVRKTANQLSITKKENLTLRGENADLKSRCEALTSGHQRSSEGASEQSREYDKLRIDLTERLVAADALTANKNSQLLETIKLNQRLESQIRYLAVHAFSTHNPLEGQGEETDGASLIVVDEQDDEGRFDRLVQIMPEVRATAALTDKLTIQSNGGESNATGESETELLAQLRETLRVLQTSYAGSRVEFRLEVRQRALLEERLAEQQAEIDRLHKKLSSSDTELETASGSADTLKQQISEAMSEVAHYKLLIAQTDDSMASREEETQHLRRETARLEECLCVSEQARSDLSSICAERIRDCSVRANEYVRGMKEAVELQREDMLARLVSTAALSEELRVAVSAETQRELQRLRDELFKARRNETQKEREIAFLQRQLVEAARRIAQESVEREQQQQQQSADKSQSNNHLHYMGNYEV